MSNEGLYRIQKLRRRYVTLRITEIVLQVVGLTLLTLSLLRLTPIDLALRIVLSAMFGSAFVFIQIFRNNLHRLNDGSLAQYLNQNFLQMKDSADLMLHDEAGLTDLQKIQRTRIAEQFNLLFPVIKLPHHIVLSLGVFVSCLLIYIFLSSFSLAGQAVGAHPTGKGDLTALPGAVSMTARLIRITPPAYTGQPSFTTNNFDIAFAEGSDVHWQLEFSGQPKNVSFIFSGSDSVGIVSSQQKYETHRAIYESGFYQIQWSYNTLTTRSGYHQLEAIKDHPPKVEVKNLQQFTQLKYDALQPLPVTSALSDDYGLIDAALVATVSKGSGEGVKFREERLKFTTPEKIHGKSVTASRSLDLKKLGLDPGDELYFYVEAWDNKMPSPNHTRTETFFIAVLDTATEITTVDSGLGVDLMPEYFRSQRQIIIDTEKLLRDKKRIAAQAFNSTSNELGYDQKVLRLRYGQFLGEEDEAGIGQEAVQQEEEQDVTKQYGHTHDTKNEHNLVEQKKDDHHRGEAKNPDDKEDPIKAFAHSHDNSEVATFFIQSLKAKLKAAVTIMWDAELYLRLYQPEKSLPYQYKALNLLKEISNDSRIYVHRTGFDPPPLKEEKRLTADLSEVKTNISRYQSPAGTDHPAIRQALNTIEKLLLTVDKKVSAGDRIIFRKAGQELSAEALKMPLPHLKSLSYLQSLTDQAVNGSEIESTLLQIRKSFWIVLGKQSSSPGQQSAGSTKIDQQFLKALGQIQNE